MKRRREIVFLFVLLATCLTYGLFHSYTHLTSRKLLAADNHITLPGSSQIQARLNGDSQSSLPGSSQIHLTRDLKRPLSGESHTTLPEGNQRPLSESGHVAIDGGSQGHFHRGSHVTRPEGTQEHLSGGNNAFNSVAQEEQVNVTKRQSQTSILMSRREAILNRRMKWKGIAERRSGYMEKGMSNVAQKFESRANIRLFGKDAGYFDCPNMTPLRFLPDFKSPCWNGTSDNGPVHDNNIHCLPYFYIIGVMKCGTSDLFRRLVQHPDIVDPGFKEPQWLGNARQRPWNGRGMDKRQLSYYVNQYKSGTTSVLRQPSPTSSGTVYFAKVFADGSPSTIFRNDGWKRLPGNENATEPRYTNVHCIHSLFPGAKIIVIFRDPVTRLYSDYLFRHRYATSTRPSRHVFHNNVVKATNEFHTCLQKHSLRTCVYNDRAAVNEQRFKFRLDLGMYSVYMRDVYTVFRRENVHTILLPDYHEKMAQVLQKAFAFLGLRSLDQSELQPMLTMDVANAKTYIKERAGSMLNETEQIIRQFYAPYNEEMAKLMGDSRYLFSER